MESRWWRWGWCGMALCQPACVPEKEALSPSIERDGAEKDSYAELGLESIRYRIVGEYSDPDEKNPIFHVIRPVDGGGEPRPVLFWLHGAALGIEGDPEWGKNCGAVGVQEELSRLLRSRPGIALELASRGWTWVIPENPWCDLWAGRGEQDPVDPGHQGTRHVQRVLQALEEGFDGNQASEIYGWGTSIGGMAIVSLSAQTSLFQAVVADSGPVDSILWYQEGTEVLPLEHVLGGPPSYSGGSPTEWYPNYERLSGSLLVDQGWDTPVFVVYNTYDHLVPARMNREFTQSLSGREGRYFALDMNRHFPEKGYHVQTSATGVPGSWLQRLAFDFLEQAGQPDWIAPIWLEAEDGCADCPRVGEPIQAEAEWSGGVAVQRVTSAGLLTELVLSEDWAGKAIEILPILSVEGQGSSLPVRLSISTPSGLWASWEPEFFADPGSAQAPDWMDQLEKTRWAPDPDGDGRPDPLPVQALSLKIEALGVGSTTLDAVVLRTP